jgi:hypothetical protein
MAQTGDLSTSRQLEEGYLLCLATDQNELGTVHKRQCDGPWDDEFSRVFNNTLLEKEPTRVQTV